MDTLVADVRQTLRHIRRHPVFARVAAASLAIGVGANTAIFNVVKAVLLRPVSGVQAPERVMEVGRTTQGHGFDTFAYPEYEDMKARVPAFESLAAYTFEILSLSRGSEGERITGMHVSPSYFRVMGVAPGSGRFFTDDEDLPGSRPAVAVLSHDFWRNRLGGDDLIGQTVMINRVPVTVVGIAPQSFRGHTIGFQPDVYLPIRSVPLIDNGLDEFEARGASWLMAVGRLAQGSSPEVASAQLAALFEQLQAEYPEATRERGARVVRLGLVPGAARGGVSAFFGVLGGMVVLILLVTCANVAGMFLARATTRGREIAVRLAVGASRRRLVRQLLTEALVVFAIGGAIGGALGVWLVGLVPLHQLPFPIPIHVDLSPDLGVLLFALATTLATGLIFGLLPAMQATRMELVPYLRDDGGGRGRVGWMRRAFVGGQIGLSLVLLVAAGLFQRSLQRAAEVETGFDPSDAYMTMVDLSVEGYEEEEGAVLQRRLLERLRRLPGAEGAALASDLPLDLSSSGTVAWPEGWADEDRVGVDFNYVSPGYFETLKIPVLHGRDFSSGDLPGSGPVLIVSHTFADRVWPGEDPLGRRVRVGLRASDDAYRTVVGVVEDVKNQILTEAPKPFVYVPLLQSYRPTSHIVLRAEGGMATVAPALRQAILELDGSLALTPVLSLERYTSIGILPQRVAAWVTSALGSLALLLAGIGIYGVVAVSVGQRTREIGVRLALGATRGRVLRLVMRGALVLALPGLLLGGAAALGVGRVLRFLLLGLSPVDPVALGSVAAMLAAVVLVAAIVPARRAAALEPTEALRGE
ncbi:MAG: ABC transporter permease [Gemmatimonadota bacterium]